MRHPVAWIALILLVPTSALGHGGQPTVAWINDPIGVGNVVDQSFRFTWLDYDRPVSTGTATVDLYYVVTRPPTFAAGIIPDVLDGTPIVMGILEKDTANAYVWDTSSVPAGSYMIWSRVNEPPSEVFSPQIISYSPGVVTIAHPGDALHPAVMITTPDTAFRFADQSFDVKYAAFDPDGSGRVKIEGGTSLDGTGFVTLGEDLPAVADGTVTWDTSGLPELDYTLRATITDARGMSYVHYGRYFLLVTHLGPTRDAGARDGASSDGSAIPDYDGGEDIVVPPPKKSCGCTATGRPESPMIGWALLSLLALSRRRR